MYTPHHIFRRSAVASVLFCSLKKGIAPKIRMLCFVIFNSVLFNLLRVWISFSEIKAIKKQKTKQKKQEEEKEELVRKCPVNHTES